MNKYQRMVNPPRFNGEWKYYAFFLLDLATIGGCVYWARIMNNLFQLSLGFAILHYIFWITVSLIIVWRPYNNPGQRQIFLIIESLLYADKNHYHALDPIRNYHGRR